MDERPPSHRLAPGAVYVSGWLTLEEQLTLVHACRGWARPPAGMRAARTPTGALMSAQTVCLGWHWYPYRYSRTIDDGDGGPVKPFPDSLRILGERALEAAELDYRGYRPDTALINFYGPDAKMGLHQDREERSPAPVVSVSLGDTGLFRFGNTLNRNKPWTDIELHSGDLFVFGGPSRLAFHGVTKILAGSPPELGLLGRLNITLRESGLA